MGVDLERTPLPERDGAGWRAEHPADGMGLFEWDVHTDRWSWSEELFALHGYEPDAVVPTLDLVVGHKVAEDRRRAERLLSLAVAPDFRFHHLHAILDASGRRREVLSIGSAVRRRAGDGVRHVMRGYMVEVTDLPRGASRAGAGPRPLPSRAALDARVDGEALLTRRELDVVELIAAGLSNDEIAGRLFVSVNTVKTYVRTAYRKIGVNRRSDAIVWAHNRR